MTIPQIKNYIEKEGTTLLPEKFSICPQLSADSDIFYQYIRKYKPNARLSKAEGKVIYDNTLEAEEYRITVSDSVTIFASGNISLNHAFASLVQLTDSDGTLKKCEISDKPDFPYRSFMVDVGRQTHPIKYILDYLDLCWLYKLSYIQLHLSDDPGVAVPVKSFPNLATEGRAYTPEEIEQINLYAKERGISIVPELEVPGHAEQFMKKYPEIFGSLNIVSACDEVFEALYKIYDDIIELFPYSKYIHIGGDEASIGEWQSCERTQRYMKANNISSIDEMYAEFVKKVTDYILSKGKTPIVWEGFGKEYNDRIDKRVIVVSWENYYQTTMDLAKAGFTLINCSWQPLYIVTPIKYWESKDILEKWNIYNWQHWWDKSKAYGDIGITVGETDVNLLGAQLCAWGNELASYEDYEKGCKEEYDLVKDRLPALAEKSWNKDSKMTDREYKEILL